MDAVEEATWEHWAATEVINFGIGQPDEALLPREMLAEAAAAQLGSGSGGAPTPSFLNYAAYVGPRSFVNTLASFLTTALGESVASEELFTTNGCSQAIEFVTLQLAPPGSCVFIEEPTYFLVHNIFRDCHVNPVAVPLGPDGSLDLDALEVLSVGPSAHWLCAHLLTRASTCGCGSLSSSLVLACVFLSLSHSVAGAPQRAPASSALHRAHL
eukprot:m.145755 g.145755  ORF g.145755 m.145755 type:complete len:213 (+) comp10084_c0_seq1:79-717(+)